MARDAQTGRARSDGKVWGRVALSATFAVAYLVLGAAGLYGWLGNSDDPALAIAAYSWTVAVWIVVRTFAAWHMGRDESIVRTVGGLLYALVAVLSWPPILLALVPPVVEAIAMACAIRVSAREKYQAGRRMDGLQGEAGRLGRIARRAGVFR